MEKTRKVLRDKDGLTEEEFLQAYNVEDYIRPSVAADMAIFTITEKEEENYRKLSEKQLSILLIKRGIHPFLGCWALPGGFARPGETIEETARRELQEETGLSQVYMEQLYTFSEPFRDPRTWVISSSYLALIDGTQAVLQAGDDADSARWFNVSFRLLDEQKGYQHNPENGSVEAVIQTKHYELTLFSGKEEDNEPIVLRAVMEKKKTKTEQAEQTSYQIIENDGLAFDHAKIIAYALERLRGKVEYSGLALHLMPSLFTLTQLQQAYEVILGKPLLKPAFRRKIAPFVEETNDYTKKEGHRPSRFYRRKWEI